MTKKYEFSGETKYVNGIRLKRIKALVDISNHSVKAGDLGGWLQSETNLSHDGDAWVFGDAWVYGNAQVYGDARVYGNAQVSENARVYGDARVFGNAQVSENAQVYGKAQVSENAWVSGDAWVFGKAQVSGNAQVHGDAQVFGDARVFGKAWVYGSARVSGNAQVARDAQACGVAAIRAGIVAKDSDLVVVQLKPYNLTFTPGFINIGCKCKTTTEWLETTPEQAEDMGLPASKFKYYERIIKTHIEGMLINE